ncbi:MAG: WD40 repeat domain-containing protein [Spirochaetota bacterium]
MPVLRRIIIPVFTVVVILSVVVICTGESELLEPVPGESDPTIISIDMDADGNRLVAGTEGGGVYTWDIQTNMKKQVLPVSTLAYHDVLFSPDGKYLAAGTWDHNVYIVDMASSTVVAHMKGSGHGPCRLSFSPDGSLLVSSNWERQVYLWHVPSGRRLHVMRGEEDDEILDVAICDKCSCVAGLIKNEREGKENRYGLLRTWDIHTGRVKTEQHVQDVNARHEFLVSIESIPETGMMAIGSDRPAVVLFNLKTKQVARAAGHVEITPFSLRTSMDGRILVARDQDGASEVFDMHNGDKLARFAHYGGSSAVAIDGHGRVVAYSLFYGDDAGNTATGVMVRDLRKDSIISILEL